ncbi:MAG: GH25 family lysozyme, partial [Sporomusa sp.]
MSNTYKGVDVSYSQSKSDWAKVKAAGIDFAIIRAGYCYNNGNLKEDTMFKTHIQGAIAAGLDVGVYLFSYALTAEAAKVAAQELLELIAPYKLTMP